MEYDYTKLKRRVVELNKTKKRKELDDMAIKFGVDTRYMVYDCQIGPDNKVEDNCSKIEVCFIIAENEQKVK